MEQIRDLAIVLKWVPYEERHRVVTALTQNHGKISALARNSIQSRRFGGALEPFAASEWRFVERSGADLYRVEGAEIRRDYAGVRADFGRLTLASILTEIMLRMAPERQPCPELFKLHANALASLEVDPAELSLLNAYVLKALQWSGNLPQLGHCLDCGTPIAGLAPDCAIRGVVADAGWTCCRGRREGESFNQLFVQLTPAGLRDLVTALDLPIRQATQNATAARREQRVIFGFLESILIYHVPGFDRTPLKSTQFLDSISAPQDTASRFGEIPGHIIGVPRT